MSAATAGAARLAPLDADSLRTTLIVPAGLWTDIQISARTGSTNSDVQRLASDGASEGLVVATEWQTAGRGRQGRQWHASPGAALTFSLLLRPRGVPQAARVWVPLLAGLATATAVRGLTGADASLKWPNDVMIGDGKLAGVLAEQHGEALVVGIGLNVLGRQRDLPVPAATSLELHGSVADRTDLLAEILREIERWYRHWSLTADAEASGLRAAYLRCCGTVGRRVNVALPGGRTLAGTAADVDRTGQLVVRTATGQMATVRAGDVIHVR